jgi:hypothetical protein
MLNQLQRGDEPALLPCRRSGFLRRPYLGHRNIQHTVRYTATNPAWFEKLWL